MQINYIKKTSTENRKEYGLESYNNIFFKHRTKEKENVTLTAKVENFINDRALGQRAEEAGNMSPIDTEIYFIAEVAARAFRSTEASTYCVLCCSTQYIYIYFYFL